MKFTLVGNGRMGHEVAAVIESSPLHSVAAVLDIDAVITPEVFQGSDAIIDFTVRDAFLQNLDAMLGFRGTCCSGTPDGTGFVRKLRLKFPRPVRHFSPRPIFLSGSMFFAYLREAARLIAPFGQFDIAVEEQHHTGKVDFPSGTALAAANVITVGQQSKTAYCS